MTASWSPTDDGGVVWCPEQVREPCLQGVARITGGLVGLIEDGTISGKIAKDVFADMFETGKDAATIVEEKASDFRKAAIEAMIDEVIAANGDKVEEYRGGKELFGFCRPG